MRVRALKTFSGKFGLIREGTVFESDPGYFRALSKNGLAEEIGDPAPTKPGEKEPGPDKNRDLQRPPNRAGKGVAPVKGGKSGVTVRPLAAGKGGKSSSLRADLASHGKTSKLSEAGGSNTPAPETLENPADE